LVKSNFCLHLDKYCSFDNDFNKDKKMKARTHNKKYMIIALSVLIAEFTARNNGGAARQENRPQSATAYSSERWQ
jgi:hypothetical protein